MVVMVVMAIEQPIPKTMVVVATCIMRVLDHHGGCGLNPVCKNHAEYQNGIQKFAIKFVD